MTESKPDNSLADLRLNDPWPELADLVQRTHHLRPEITRKEKKHTPFVVILVHEWARWKEQVRTCTHLHSRTSPLAHSPMMPINSMMATSRHLANDTAPSSNNCARLVPVSRPPATSPRPLPRASSSGLCPRYPTTCRYCWTTRRPRHSDPTRRSSGSLCAACVRYRHLSLSLSRSLALLSVACKSARAHVVLDSRSLSQFAAKHNGYLPLSGSLPDMTSDTKSYLALQQCFNDKATRDREEFVTIVNELLSSVGRETVPSDSQEIELFCKNARDIRVYRLRSIADELTPTPEQGAKLRTWQTRERESGRERERRVTSRLTRLALFS